MVNLDELNEKQREAVVCTDNHIRVIAGPGAGKTKVLTTRIAYLMEHENVYPDRILAITFTNKAANEMKKRVAKLMNQEIPMNISTIHSLCVKILRKDGHFLGYPVAFQIIDTEDQEKIVKDILNDMGLDKKAFPVKPLLNKILNYKFEHISPEDAIKFAYGNRYELQKIEVYKRYVERLWELKAMDFDDLVLNAQKVLKKFDASREFWSEKFEHILVDEFHDTDDNQYDVIKMLASYHNRLFVIADPDQSIYSFRGADVSLSLDFDKVFPDATTIILNKNYRSSKNILSAASSLIKRNKQRIDKDLQAVNDEGVKVQRIATSTDDEEANIIVENMLKLHDEEGIKYSEMAVLYRSNYLSKSIEKALTANGIVYDLTGGVRFLERKEIKDALAYLRLMTYEDDLSFERVLGTQKRGIGKKSVDNLRDFARKNQTKMYEAVKSGKYKENTKFVQFIEEIEEFKKLLDIMSWEKALKTILDKTGYWAELAREEEDERMENILSLYDTIASYKKDNPTATLDEYLQQATLQTDKESKKPDETAHLMTVHSAKGLEFDVVFIIGLSDNVFPNGRAMEEGGLEEERRLFYVAMTRARKYLYLCENMGYSSVTRENKYPSRFLGEVDKEFIFQAVKRKLSNLWN